MESFGQTASEALACGTPVVAFNATGLKDIIEHKICGYMAQPFDTDDLANGINWILEDEHRYSSLCMAARKRAEAQFDIKIIVGKYIQLYKKVLNQ